MTIKNTQKYSLITGAGSGLGFEFARICAANNYSLILIDKDKEKLESSSGYLRSTFNVTVTAFEKDLSQNNCALDIFNSVNEKGIIPEILINNAGFGYFGLFAENNWQKQEELIRLLVLTTTHLTKLFLPGMILNKYGRILNVSSLAAFQPGPLMSVYHASKSFILSFSQALSNELNGSGVTVTVLCPGMMATGFQKANNNESPNLKWSVGSAEKVARIGYKGMMKGKVVIIPGIMNQIGANLPRFLPRSFTTTIVRNIQEKNRRKLANNKS